MLQFFLRSRWKGVSVFASSLLLSACNFNLANSPFDGIRSFNNSNNSNQLTMIVLDSSDRAFAREMVTFLGRNKVQVLTKNSTAGEMVQVINRSSYEQYLAYLANQHGYASWSEWQQQPAEPVLLEELREVPDDSFRAATTTNTGVAAKAQAGSDVSSQVSAQANSSEANVEGVGKKTLEDLPAHTERFDFAKFWAVYPNVKIRQQVLQVWNPEQDPTGFKTLFQGAHATATWLNSAELRSFLKFGLFGTGVGIMSQEQWLALQAAVPNHQLLEFTPAIEGCREELSFTCVARYVPTLRVTNINTQTKALSVFPNNGVVAQEAFIVSINTELLIPGAGVIQLNDMSQNDYVSNQYTPLASINRNSLLLTTAYKDLSRKIATKVVFVYNNQKIGDRQQWQQLK